MEILNTTNQWFCGVVIGTIYHFSDDTSVTIHDNEVIDCSGVFDITRIQRRLIEQRRGKKINIWENGKLV